MNPTDRTRLRWREFTTTELTVIRRGIVRQMSGRGPVEPPVVRLYTELEGVMQRRRQTAAASQATQPHEIA